MCVRVCICVCLCFFAYVCMCVRVCMHACLRDCVHAYVRVCMRTCLRASVRACGVHACECVYACTCVLCLLIIIHYVLICVSGGVCSGSYGCFPDMCNAPPPRHLHSSHIFLGVIGHEYTCIFFVYGVLLYK